MKTFIALNFLFLLPCTLLLAQVPDREVQLMTAVLAAPEDMREHATVMGYNTDGSLTVLHQGTNELICLADNPEKEGVNIACYHKDLEPFMKRGRELRASGMGRMEVFEKRDQEVQDGELFMPEGPSTLYIFYGDEGIINWENGEVNGGKMRFVVYIPFATQESTGLAVKPLAPGTPWLMDAGTYRAHIMITPK